MKKTLVVLVVTFIFLLMAACVPENPEEIPQYCQEMYDANPDYPPAFVGACISVLESGNYGGMASLCGWEELQIEMGFSSRKECVQYFVHYED